MSKPIVTLILIVCSPQKCYTEQSAQIRLSRQMQVAFLDLLLHETLNHKITGVCNLETDSEIIIIDSMLSVQVNT